MIKKIKKITIIYRENKDHFYEIKGTPYYHRRSSRKVLFQCLTTLKDKIIPFSVYFTYKPV